MILCHFSEPAHLPHTLVYNFGSQDIIFTRESKTWYQRTQSYVLIFNDLGWNSGNGVMLITPRRCFGSVKQCTNRQQRCWRKEGHDFLTLGTTIASQLTCGRIWWRSHVDACYTLGIKMLAILQ